MRENYTKTDVRPEKATETLFLRTAVPRWKTRVRAENSLIARKTGSMQNMAKGASGLYGEDILQCYPRILPYKSTPKQTGK